MPRLPTLKPQEVIKTLRKLDFIELRQKGSHRFFYRASDKRATVIPIHNRDLGRGLLRQIISDVGLSVDEFLKATK